MLYILTIETFIQVERRRSKLVLIPFVRWHNELRRGEICIMYVRAEKSGEEKRDARCVAIRVAPLNPYRKSSMKSY